MSICSPCIVLPVLSCLPFTLLKNWFKKRDVSKISAAYLSYPQLLWEPAYGDGDLAFGVFYSWIMSSCYHERELTGGSALCQMWQIFKVDSPPLPPPFLVSGVAVFFHLVTDSSVVFGWSRHLAQYCALDLGKRSVSHSVVSDSLQPRGLQPTRLFCPWNSPGTTAGVGCHLLLQRIFLTPGLNLDLLHCRRIIYCYSLVLISRKRRWLVEAWCVLFCFRWSCPLCCVGMQHSV